MPSFDIIKIVNPEKTFRVASVMGKFDLQSNEIRERFVGELEIPENWQIGLIVGKSGTGKTTIAKQLFEKAYITNFDYTHETILDDMPENKTIEEITKTFNSVGFSSPPSWLKPYAVLSNGEKMRVDLARAILNEDKLFVFDEFTSVVDRQVAKIGSFAMQKAIRKTEKRFIAVTCHFDVEEWLLPDWIFDTDTMIFRKNESEKKNRPNLRFAIYETTEKTYYWKMFSKYHYLSHSHNNAARVFIATIDDEICGFYSVLHLPNQVKNMKIAHRLVIFPDYQGIGIGSHFDNIVANLIVSEGNRFVGVTSSPALIFARKKDPNWRCTKYGRKRPQKYGSMAITDSSNRITTSWEFIPIETMDE